MRQVRKFFNTLRVCGAIIMARTFGYYRHSGWDESGEFAIYERGGVTWRIPMFPSKTDF